MSAIVIASKTERCSCVNNKLRYFENSAILDISINTYSSYEGNDINVTMK